ncbi:MAG: lamin tail domain-containing protein [Candidatus Kaiserbacteria bacterium]|nr:lamin tail domain-containing protein [Candidatus Kaiserbacteria bacterium]
MQKICLIFSFVPALVVGLLFSVLPTYAQGSSVELSEVLYAPRDGGEWVEVVNNSNQSLDLTALSVTVSSGGDEKTSTIMPHQTTSTTLRPGGVAIIAADPDDFRNTYQEYTGPLFQATMDLPDIGTPRITISVGNTVIYQTSYTSDPRANNTGVSLHVTEYGLVVAPATPGEVARNPLESYRVQPQVTSVTTAVTGGNDTPSGVFLDAGDGISLRIFHTERIPQLTADLYIGDQRLQRNFIESPESDDVQQVFTYIVQEDDETGTPTFSVESESDSVAEGEIVHHGKTVIIDTTPPILSVSRQETSIEISIEEDHLVQTVRYKVLDDGTCDAEGYQALSSTEHTRSIPPVFSSARIDLSETEQIQPLCVTVSDLAGNTTYVLSPSEGGNVAVIETGPLAAHISEISYSTSAGITTEWIEVTNDGDAPLDLTFLTLIDGDRSRTITHREGSTLVASQSSAIIAKKPEAFSSDFPDYSGPLFRSPMSLLDSGDTLSLQVTETGQILDTVTYSSSDGAKKDGMTLHILEDDLFPGPPTPGTQHVTHQQVAEDPTLATASGLPGTRPVIAVTHINGRTVPSGKNLFFITTDTARATFIISDDVTQYTDDTVVSQYGLTLTPSTQNSALRVSDPVIQNRPNGSVRADYTLRFSRQSDGMTRDNRVALALRVRDEGGQENDPRDDIVIVRNTTPPTIMNGITNTEITFSGEAPVIIPVRVAGIQMGDWLRVTYGGSCGEGLLPFIVRNGGHGVLYRLDNGTYTDCTISVTDTAGNTGDILKLPKITVRQ